MRTAAALAADRSSGSHSFEIVSSEDGKAQIRGALTFATARRAREAGLVLISASTRHDLAIDCAGVTASDSAGLTVLLDWLALAKKGGRSLRYVNLPQGLLAIAKISEVEQLLLTGV